MLPVNVHRCNYAKDPEIRMSFFIILTPNVMISFLIRKRHSHGQCEDERKKLGWFDYKPWTAKDQEKVETSKSTVLPIPRVQTSDLQSSEILNFCYFKSSKSVMTSNISKNVKKNKTSHMVDINEKKSSIIF
jgi:hypothetical protein